MKKYERQKVKEEAVAMTNKLNQDWRSVMKLLPQKVHFKGSCLPITIGC